MPIYEFKCLKCEDLFEILLMGEDDRIEMKCPKCESRDIERVLSAGSHSMASGGQGATGGNNNRAGSRTRNCSSGSCTTYTIPGPG